jgi:hypothetical protein
VKAAILSAEAAKQSLRESHGQSVSIICVDPWTPYLSLEENPHLWPMRKAAVRDKIFSLFLKNVKSLGHSDVIIPVRTWSHIAARFFRAELFDMIFIDGDHAYASVARDIRDYAPLAMDGGYICGDDLQLQMSEIDGDLARRHPDEDLVRDATSGTDFHPGVTLAVGEYFGESAPMRGSG